MASGAMVGGRSISRTKSRFRRGRAAVLIAALSVFASESRAATLIWDSDGIPGNGATDGIGNWDTIAGATNWFDGTTDLVWNNANNDIAVFGNGGNAGTGVITIQAGITVGGITINTPGSGTNYSLTGGNAVTLANGAAITVNATGTTVGTAVAGSNWAKNGIGNLTLTSTQLWTGNATINGGGLLVSGNGGALVSGATISLNNGTSFTFGVGNGSTSNATAAGATNTIAIVGGPNTTATFGGTGYSDGSTAQRISLLFTGNGNLSWNAGALNAWNANSFLNYGGTVTWANGNGIRVAGGNSTQNMPFATLDLGASTAVLNTRGTNNTAFIMGGLAGGSSTNLGSGTTGTANVLTVGSANGSQVFSGGLFQNATSTNATTVTKVGLGTWTLRPSAVYATNATNLAANGGVLLADFASLATPTDLFKNTSTLGLGGGTFNIKGKDTGATLQTLGALQVNSGGSRLVIDPNGGTSTTLTLGALGTGVAGGTLNIQPPDAALGSGTAVIRTTSVLSTTGTSAATSVYSNRFTYGSDWMTGGTSSFSTLAPYSSYNDLSASVAAGTNVTNDRLNDVGNATLAGDFTTNTLKITNTTAQSLDLGGFALTLSTGGLLFTGSASYTIGTSVNNGTLKPTNSEVILHQLGTGTLTINSVIANGTTSSLTKGGSGTLVLAGTNTYTGSTFLNGGVTSIGAASAFGVPAATSTITLNGGTLQATGTFALPGGSTGGIRIGGGGATFEVTGTNNLTLSGVVSNLNANQFGPLIKTGTGVLTLGGANTYGGSTIIRGGTVSVASLADGGATSGIGNSVLAAPALVLDGGALQYTGPVQSTNRTFTLGAGGGGLDASGSGALAFSSAQPVVVSGAGARTLNLTGSSLDNNTLAAPITNPASGATTVTKTGVGKWILTGTHSYTGNTSISGGGTLALSSATSTNTIASSPVINVGTGSKLDVTGLSGSAITLASTQTLTGPGTVAGGVKTTGGSFLAPGTGVGQLNVDALTLAAGSIENFEFNASPANDRIAIATAGGFTLNGGGFNLLQEGSLVNKFTTTGTYTLITYAGSIGGTGLDATWTTASATNPHVLNPQTGLTYAFADTGAALTLTIGGQSALVSQWISTTDGNWTDGTRWSSNPNFPTAAGDTANFTTAQSTVRTVTLNASEIVGSLNFDSATAGYNLVASGGSILTLDNAGTDAGIGVVAGSHTIAVPLSLKSNLAVTLAGAGSSVAITGDISNGTGTRTLAKTGSGLLALSGNNSYGPAAGTVGTTLGGGTLQVGSNTALGAGDLAVTADAALRAGVDGLIVANNVVTTAGVTTSVDTQAITLTLSGVLGQSGATGALTKLGTGTLILANNNTFAGNTTISTGTLVLGAGGGTGSVGGPIVNNAALLLNRSDGYNLGNFISGTGTLTKAGVDNVTLTNTNSFTGDTVVSGGILTIGNTQALAGSTLNYDSQGGNLSFGTQTAVSIGGLRGAQNLGLTNATPAAVALTVGGNNSTTEYSGALSGGGSLTKTGTGVLTLTGNNSYTGSTTSNGGQIVLGTNGVINGAGVFANDGNIQINGGTLTANAASAIDQNQNITVTAGSATFAGINSTSAGGDGITLRVDGGTMTTTFYSIFRNQTNTTLATTAGAVGTSGFYATGGTSTFTTDLNIGTGNSSATSKVDGASASVTVNGAVNISNAGTGRFNMLAVNSGTFSATSTTAGIIMSPGAGNSQLLMTGGTVSTGRIGFGTATTAGGSGWVFLNGGTLYVGSGGIETPTGSTVTPYIGLAAGTVGANANWSSALPMVIGTQTVAYTNAAATPAAATATLTAAGGLTFKAADTNDVARNITLTGGLSGAGALTKTGGGILTLGGANTYTGNTAINGGTFAIGSGGSVSASGVIAVASGAALDVTANGGMTFNNQRIRGSGEVYGPTTFTGTGAIAPGGTVTTTGIGQLKTTDAMTLSGSGSQLIIEIGDAVAGAPGVAGVNYDQVKLDNVVDKTFTVGGATLSVLAVGNPAVNQAYRIVNFVGTGADNIDESTMFANLTSTANPSVFAFQPGDPNFSYTVDFSTNGAIDLTFQAVPEPAGLGLVGLGTVGLLSRRRRVLTVA